MSARQWFASAFWAGVCGLACQVFVSLLLVGAVAIFMAVALAPLVFLVIVSVFGGPDVALVVAGVAFVLWIVVLVGSGLVTRWSFRRCRVIHAALRAQYSGGPRFAAGGRQVMPPSPFARWSSIVAGVLASVIVLSSPGAWLDAMQRSLHEAGWPAAPPEAGKP